LLWPSPGSSCSSIPVILRSLNCLCRAQAALPANLPHLRLMPVV
jgi:hypothetical protein